MKSDLKQLGPSGATHGSVPIYDGYTGKWGFRTSALGFADEVMIRMGTSTAVGDMDPTTRLLELVTGNGAAIPFFIDVYGTVTTGSGYFYGPGWGGGGVLALLAGTADTSLTTAGGSSQRLMLGPTGARLYGGLGAGASDVCVRAGSSVAAASVHATAKLFSVRAGLDATETEYFSINKTAATFAGTVAASNLSGSNTGDQDLSGLVVKNAAITAGTNTKITYDAKGLVTAGAAATTADIADSTNARYCTDAQKTVIGNTSGTNSGDVTVGTTTTAQANGASISSQVLHLSLADASNPGIMTAAGFTNLGNQSGTNSGDVTLGAFGSTPNANGASLSTQAITLQPADGTYPGGVSTAAQTFAGTKTFSNIISPTIYNTNGTGASDICVKIGSSVADGSVNATAKLFSVRTGIGGTEVEKLLVDKLGLSIGSLRLQPSSTGVTPGPTIWTEGTVIHFATYCEVSTGLNLQCDTIYTHTSTGLNLFGQNGTGASDLCLKVGTTTADASVNATAKLLSLRTGVGGTEVEKAAISSAGRIDQSGTDSSGTPGAATINKPTGVSAIASGQTTCQINNSLTTATSRVTITWYSDHGATRSWVARAAGSFTVTLSSAATADTSFGWEVSAIL